MFSTIDFNTTEKTFVDYRSVPITGLTAGYELGEAYYGGILMPNE